MKTGTWQEVIFCYIQLLCYEAAKKEEEQKKEEPAEEVQSSDSEKTLRKRKHTSCD